MWSDDAADLRQEARSSRRYSNALCRHHNPQDPDWPGPDTDELEGELEATAEAQDPLDPSSYSHTELRSTAGALVAVVPSCSAAVNARRLVACWNACEGISTEDLEKTGTMAAEVDGGMQTELIRAFSQRDELLEACRNARDLISVDRQSFIDASEIRDARIHDPIAHGLVQVSEDVWIDPEDADAVCDYDRGLAQIDAAIDKATREAK